MACRNCLNRANKDKFCVIKNRNIITVEDAILFCRTCTQFNPCGGFLKRSFGWDNGKENKREIYVKARCEECGNDYRKKVERDDIEGRKKLKCMTCGFTEFR